MPRFPFVATVTKTPQGANVVLDIVVTDSLAAPTTLLTTRYILPGTTPALDIIRLVKDNIAAKIREHMTLADLPASVTFSMNPIDVA